MLSDVLVHFRMFLKISSFFLFLLISFTHFDYFLFIFSFVLFCFDSVSMFWVPFCSAVALLGPILAQASSKLSRLEPNWAVLSQIGLCPGPAGAGAGPNLAQDGAS